MSDDTTSAPNPSGLCMCGCGNPAPIAKGSDKRYGIVHGLPQRYIKGHQHYKSHAHYLVDEKGCWVWQRAVNSSGYGHLYVDGVHKYAHVHYWEQANSESAESGREITSSQVHHTCGNKLCVNPDHLELHSTEGHRREHGIAKLRHVDVRHIRRLCRSGRYTQQEIGDIFGVSQSRVSAIARRASWAHVD